MTGTILQINVSPGGIPKRPIVEATVTAEGIHGDSWAHPNIHGGPNKALLLITSEGIDELVAQGFPLFPGALGENLTTTGLDRRQMRAGQRYRAGEVFLELTKLRAPCETLDVYGPRHQDCRLRCAGQGRRRFLAALGTRRILRPRPASRCHSPARYNLASGPSRLTAHVQVCSKPISFPPALAGAGRAGRGPAGPSPGNPRPTSKLCWSPPPIPTPRSLSRQPASAETRRSSEQLARSHPRLQYLVAVFSYSRFLSEEILQNPQWIEQLADMDRASLPAEYKERLDDVLQAAARREPPSH